jgi:hypothetical protein
MADAYSEELDYGADNTLLFAAAHHNVSQQSNQVNKED